MNKTLRILQICPRIPYPPDDGGKIGIFNITKQLALKGHDLTMLTFSDGGPVPEAMNQFARIIQVKHGTRTNLAGIAKNVFSELPYTVSKYQSVKMEEQLRELCGKNTYDVIHVDHLHLAHYGLIAKREFGIPYCLREHNYETIIYQRFADIHGISLFKLYLKMQSERIRKYETGQISETDLCIAITDDDREKISRTTNARLCVIPAGVDLELHPLLERGNEKQNSILIVGHLQWAPNRDAIRWFLDEVFPLVQERVPDAEVTIAGMSPSKDLLRRQNGTIRFPGFVQDLKKLIASTQVLAIPLRVGGGMRIKLLEFFAYGKAVVSTGIGAEGSRAVDGAHYVKADSARQFSDAITSLFQSGERRKELGDASRRFVEENYSWTNISGQFEDAYEETITRVKSSAPGG